MPCYSTIQTVLLDVTAIEAAAKSLGMEVGKVTSNTLILRKGREQVTLSRTREGEKFTTSFASSETSLLKSLVPAYAKEKVKQFAKSKGYVVAATGKPGQYTLTKYS